MNNQTYLALADLDDLIISYLDPPQILTLSELNIHYESITQSIRSDINLIKTDLDIACAKPSERIVQWIINQQTFKPKIIAELVKISCVNGYLSIMKILSEKYPKSIFGGNPELFHITCKYGHIDIAKWLLSQYKKHNSYYIKGHAAFSYACGHGHLAMAQWLMTLGEYVHINIHEDNDVVLQQALSDNRLDIAEWLLTLDDIFNLGNPDILVRASKGSVQMMELILSYEVGNNINTLRNRQAVFNSVYRHRDSEHCCSIIKWIVESDKKYSQKIDIHADNELVFLHACEYRDIRFAKYMVELGEESYGKIDIHDSDSSALSVACSYGNIDTVQWLIKLGEESYGRFDIHKDDDEAFRWTCEGGYVDIAKWLIELGEGSYGRINIHTDNEYAFRYAFYENETEMVKWLLELGEKSYGPIDIHANEESVFIHACEVGDIVLAQWLIELGKSSYGTIDIYVIQTIIGPYNAFEVAYARNQKDIIKWLLELSHTTDGQNKNKIMKSLCTSALIANDHDTLELLQPHIRNFSTKRMRKIMSEVVGRMSDTKLRSLFQHIHAIEKND